MSPIDYKRLHLPSLPPSFFSQKWSIYILQLSVRPSGQAGTQGGGARNRQSTAGTIGIR